MSDGNAKEPSQRPMPWETPGGAGLDPVASPPPAPVTPDPEPVSEPPTSTEDATPTEVTPTPSVDPSTVAAAGLISAAPVGWGSTPSSTIGGPPPPASGDTAAPSVGWTAPQDTSREVPGAPGLVFASTSSRFVAYLLDGFIVGIVGYIVGGILLATAGGVGSFSDTGTRSFGNGSVSTGILLFYLGFFVVNIGYFVFFWTGGRRATPGQRAFHIQVGNAFDGRGLSMGQAVRRWLGYGYLIALLALIPVISGIATLVSAIWPFLLLITTVVSPTKQGLHDKFANSALVRPKAAGSSGGLAMACLIVVGLLILLSIVSFVALIFLGGQVSKILSTVGESI